LVSSGHTRIKTTDEQTDMQHLGQKKKKNGKSANTKSALQETPKKWHISRQTYNKFDFLGHSTTVQYVVLV
jgi:hypothetical protein